MKKLEVTLKEDYRSFHNEFSSELIGDFIILSGINGSGKTQLMDIIKGYSATQRHQRISRELKQDGIRLDDTQIVHKSFRDYLTISELTTADVGHLPSTVNNLFGWYQSERLDFRSLDNKFRGASQRVKTLLIEKYGEEAFNNGSLTKEQFIEAIPREFVLFEDDIFTNRIGEIFYNYISLVENKQAEAGRLGTKFDESTLPMAPWKILNQLLEKLSVDFRFRSHYVRINDQIDEQPSLYAIDAGGAIDISKKRPLSVLSDGEKALISLTFAVIASSQTKPKLLLLDEYDATFNPSLTNAFFTILKDVFIDSGVQVLLATHSSTTLSLAPDYASFYEIYKEKGERQRILQVNRDQYEELSIANKRFYDKINDQESRFIEIETENKNLKDLVEKLQRGDSKLLIVSEGKNIKHITKAIEVLAPELLEKVEIITGAEDSTSKEQLKQAYLILSKFTTHPNTLFIWDCDASSIVDPLQETTYCKKLFFIQNHENKLMDRGIENLYPESILTSDLFTTKDENKGGGISVTVRSLSKEKVLKKILAENKKSIFMNFDPLIRKIGSLTK